MREILARSDNDFLVAEPRRKKPPRKSPFAPLISIGRFLHGVANYPNRIAGALLVGLAVAITINALELQTGRHPAPLFGRASIVQAASLARPVAAAAPAPRATQPRSAVPSAAADPLGQFIRHGETLAPAASSNAPLPAARPDPISQILRENAGAATIAPQPSRTVLAAQQALVKLGFVLRADGLEGEATRKAILQFEADHRLPQRGELSPRVIRALAAESGIAIP